jgi:hypothetical protein
MEESEGNILPLFFFGFFGGRVFFPPFYVDYLLFFFSFLDFSLFFLIINFFLKLYCFLSSFSFFCSECL